MVILKKLPYDDTYLMFWPCREESESSHESPSTAPSETSIFTPQVSSIEASTEPRTPKGEGIQPLKFTSKFEDDHSRYILDTSNSFVAQSGEDPHAVQINHSKNHSTDFSPRRSVPPLPPNPPDKAYLEEATMEEWSDGVTRFSEAIWISSPSLIVPCLFRGITIEAHCDPIMEVNILPWLLEKTLLGNVPIAPSDILLKSCPLGHILECWGIARVVPLIIGGIEASLDFHIFNVLDLDLILGSQ
jgi:hypothetical protein